MAPSVSRASALISALVRECFFAGGDPPAPEAGKRSNIEWWEPPGGRGELLREYLLPK